MSVQAPVSPEPRDIRLHLGDGITNSVDGVQRWLLSAGAFFMPLIVVGDSVDKFVLPKLVAARFLVIVLALVLLARWILTRRRTWRRTLLDLPLLALLLSTMLSTLFAVNQNVALFGFYLRYEGLFTVLTYAALFWLTVQSLNRPSDARFLCSSALAGASITSLVAIVQSLTGLGPGPDTSIGNFVRAFGTMGSPVELGTYLAMLIPLAVHRSLDETPLIGRLLAAGESLLMAAALLLTLTRGAWIAALIGVALVLLLNLSRRRAFAIGSIAAIATAALVLVLVLGFAPGRTSSLGGALGSRVQSTTSLDQGTIGDRLSVWSDSVKLLGRRPLLGSGPDSFGLVYPSVTSRRSTPGFDKAHNEILQVGVTNGLLGVLAYYLILMAIIVQLWRSRRDPVTAAMLVGLIAYEIALEAEFSWVPAAIPFWILAGVAFYGSGRRLELRSTKPRLTPGQREGLFAALVGVGLTLAFVVVPRPLQADRIFHQAIHDVGVGALDTARGELASARKMNPGEAVYAAEAGNLELNLRFGFRPGPGSDVVAAQTAYRDAVRLGTIDPGVYRGLAVADLTLGDRAEAIAAARRAVQLNWLDPDSRALLQMVETQPAT